MTGLERTMAEWTRLDEDALSRPWTWRGGKMDARWALYRTIDEAQEAVVVATTAPHPESRRVLALAQRAFGELRGLLIELPDELLDKAPRPGECAKSFATSSGSSGATRWRPRMRSSAPTRIRSAVPTRGRPSIRSM